MKILMEVVLIFYTIIFFLNEVSSNIDRKENFCGNKLMLTLKELCLMYNSPPADHYRFRRQVIQECCRSQCSRRHLVRNYCYEARSPIKEELMKPVIENPINVDQTSERKLYQIYNTIQTTTKRTIDKSVGSDSKQNHSVYSNSRLFQSESVRPSIDKRKRGKRNCKCRKRRAKKSKKLEKTQSQDYGTTITIRSANIGRIEEAQTPLYVWKLSSTN